MSKFCWGNVGDVYIYIEIHNQKMHVTDSAQGAQILVLVNMENSPILEKVRHGLKCGKHPALLLSASLKVKPNIGSEAMPGEKKGQ